MFTVALTQVVRLTVSKKEEELVKELMKMYKVP